MSSRSPAENTRNLRSSTKVRTSPSDSDEGKRSRKRARKEAKAPDINCNTEDVEAIAPASNAAAKIDKVTLQISEETGDYFAAPPNALLIHACNCEGAWGAGIAKAFKGHYPKAYAVYAKHCDEHGHDLVGRAQLIPPVDEGGPKHFVGCLYTSRSKGSKVDPPAVILKATRPAMEDLLERVREFNAQAGPDEKVGEVRMCKINSGLFKVPFEKTRAVLEQIDVSGLDVKVIRVVSPPTAPTS